MGSVATLVVLRVDAQVGGKALDSVLRIIEKRGCRAGELVGEKLARLDLAREYRTGLISAALTSRIDVREVM